MSSYFARLATSHGADRAGDTPAIAPASFNLAPTRVEPMEIDQLVEAASVTSAPEVAAPAAGATDGEPPRAANDRHVVPAAPAGRVTAADAQHATRVPERAALDEKPAPRTSDTAVVRLTSIAVAETAAPAAAATGWSEPAAPSGAPARTLPAAAARAEPAVSPSRVIRAAPVIVDAAPPPFGPVAAPAARMADPPGFDQSPRARVTARVAATPGAPAAEASPITRESLPAGARSVDVHIGRIELAISTAQAPRAAGAPVQPPLASAPRAAPREAFNAHRYYLRVP